MICVRRIGFVAVLITQTSAAIAGVAAVVDQPRPFGHVVGDLLTQRVLLQTQGGPFDPAVPPSPERVNVWFSRQRASMESDSQGRRWLTVVYQIINAPQTLTSVTLPAWKLAARRGSAQQLEVPAWTIGVGPLIPGSAEQGGARLLRPDRPAPAIPTVTIRRNLGLSSAALAVTLLAWLAWWMWRNRRANRREPFARALREMRGLDDRSPQAWQALHRAFDGTAGRVVQIATLPALFERAPHFDFLRPKIERFFAQSSELFFGVGQAHELISPRELCRELRRIERGRE